MFISINKKIISTTLILLFFLFSGINTQNNVSAQMPPTGGDFLFEESTCRNNPGTGEVFCELTLDTSSYIMTQTVAPKEYYEGQGVEKDLGKANYWYNKSTEQDNATTSNIVKYFEDQKNVLNFDYWKKKSRK